METDDLIASAGRSTEARALASILRALDLVEDRMGEDIGLEHLARAACFSPFYFSRLFSQATGHAPYDYLMRRRVAAAAEEVVSSAASITEIALDFGFGVPDSFARAFRRCFGMLPSEARKAGSFPRGIARTRISGVLVEEGLRRPWAPPRQVEVAAARLAGSWEAEPKLAALRGEWRALVVRDHDLREARVFRAEEAAEDAAPPSFPGSVTSLPGGMAARFSLDGKPGRLELLVELAYRTWLPSTGRTVLPPYDVVEIGPKGPESLTLPL